MVSNYKNKLHIRGFASVEIIIVASLVITMSVAISAAMFAALRLAESSSNQLHANLLLDETSEALQLMRDNAWSTSIGTTTTGVTYYLDRQPTSYDLTTTQPVDEAFYVALSFTELNRDAGGALDAGGTPDTSSRQVSASVFKTANNSFVADGEFLIHDAYEN